MMLVIDILVSSITGYLLFLSIKKIKKTKLYILPFYVLTFFWGSYIWVKGGLDLDYATQEEIIKNHSWFYYITGLIIWFTSIILSVVKTIMLVFKKLNTTHKCYVKRF